MKTLKQKILHLHKLQKQIEKHQDALPFSKFIVSRHDGYEMPEFSVFKPGTVSRENWDEIGFFVMDENGNVSRKELELCPYECTDYPKNIDELEAALMYYLNTEIDLPFGE